jgi:hypothetical protein
LLDRSFLSPADARSAASLGASRVSFSRRRLTRRATRFIPRFFLCLTPCPPRRSLHGSFLYPADAMPAAQLVASLFSSTCRRLARGATRCIARFFLPPTSCPPRRSLNRSFLALADTLPAVPLA